MDLTDHKQIILGADPEIFVEDDTGKNIPAFEFLPSKYEPLKTQQGMNYYWDGYQAEFNIVPSSDIKECLTSIRYGLNAILTEGINFAGSARLSDKTVIEVPLEELAIVNPEFTDFGCMPSYNIYSIHGRGGEGHKVPYRFAGGHIHFGIGPQTNETIDKLVSALDSILGVACVSLFENIDNPVRRQYYGLAGEYRTPPHGIEYRVLSDAWLFDPELAYSVLDLSRKVVASVFAGTNEWVASKGEVIESILTANATKAREILTRNMAILDGFNCGIDFTKPAQNSIPNIRYIADNWNI